MDGLNRFVKSKLDTLIMNVFKLYDFEGSGFICQEDFISMVLNYPIEMLETSLPYNFIYNSHVGEATFKSSVLKVTDAEATNDSRLQRNKGTFEARRHFSLCNNKLNLNAIHHPEKKEKAKGKKKAVPTTVNTRIKDWATSEFKNNSTDGKMMIEDFLKWAKNHHDFFNNFKIFFRTNWWLEYEDAATGQKRLSYHKLKTQIKCSGKYGLWDKPLQDVRMAIFDNLLIIFDISKFDNPIRLSILKELETECFDGERKIKLSHTSHFYNNYVLVFNSEEHYHQWKMLIQTCSQRSIRLTYTLSKRIGAGKFSKVYIAKPVKEPRNLFAVKKIDKSKLSEEEKEVLAFAHQKRNPHHEGPEQQPVHHPAKRRIRRF